MQSAFKLFLYLIGGFKTVGTQHIHFLGYIEGDNRIAIIIFSKRKSKKTEEIYNVFSLVIAFIPFTLGIDWRRTALVRDRKRFFFCLPTSFYKWKEVRNEMFGAISFGLIASESGPNKWIEANSLTKSQTKGKLMENMNCVHRKIKCMNNSLAGEMLNCRQDNEKKNVRQ